MTSSPASSHRIARRPAHTPGSDPIFAVVVILLTLLGLIMAYSTTFFWSQVQEGSPFTLFFRQVIWAGLGTLVFVVMSRLDYGLLRRYAIWIMGVCLALLIAVLLFGDSVFGAKRTLMGGSVQPSEVVKLAVIVYAAAWLASRADQVQSLADGLLPFGVIVGVVSFLIVLEPDLSTTATIVMIAMVLFFMAGASWAQILLVGAIAIGAFAVLFMLWPHASERVNEFIKVWREPNVMDYHIRQSLITLGGGGLFGEGIGAGGQKFGYLPTPHTDSVVAVLGEEMGLVGLLLMITLFVVFSWRGLRIAQQADTAFGSFLAIGVVVWVMGQMLMNMLAMLAMIPFTGVPVPFLSVGGSSLVSLLAACGVVASVARGSTLLAGEDASDYAPRTAPRRATGSTSTSIPASASGTPPASASPPGSRGQAKSKGGLFRASASVGGRNSGPRVTRTHRPRRVTRASGATPGQLDSDAARPTTFVGRDVRFNGRVTRRSGRSGQAHQPASRNPSAVRWRRGGYGT